MLKLTDLVKTYSTGSTKVTALNGINIEFRENEFVSILGPSGCGKTTMLNIIGGLDRYDSGDMSIKQKSTKKFKDSDWDSYRNHSIGFVFQNYNLIPHQTVLSNVELALTLSGVSKSERRKRAKEVLEKVGLGDQLRKKPNQMSGGQMQRVAIARALVNNPEILLADEPTGALDSGTSVQIMDLLKEIAREKLVIMVTHNPDLAEQYSSRIVRLLDGRITDDSNPYEPAADAAFVGTEEKSKGKQKKAKKQKTSMSVFTAFSLSLNNLMTKKGRTILTAFAGSIGIIGIALIMSLSNGFQLYIDKVQEDTLSSYPLTIQKESVDLGAMIATLQEERSSEADHDKDKVYSSTVMADLMNTMITEAKTNNLADFKKFIEEDENGKKMKEYTSAIQYSYDAPLNVFNADTSNGVVQVNPSKVLEKMMPSSASGTSSIFTQNSDNFWSELLQNQALLDSQYDVLAGRWPQAYNEVVIAVTKRNEISDVELYSLGLKDQKEVDESMRKIMSGEPADVEQLSFTYDELLALQFKLLLSSELYAKDPLTGAYKDLREDEILLKKAVDNGIDIKVVGIVRPNPDAASASITGVIGYTHELMEYVITQTEKNELVKAQKADPKTDVFTGLPFESDEEEPSAPDFTSMTPEQLAEYQQEAEEKQQRMQEYIATLPEETQQYLATLGEEERAALIAGYIEQAQPKTTYEQNLTKLGVADLDDPSTINLYPVDFESKESIEQLISDYNEGKAEEEQITYSDIVGIMMNSISSIINMISYVLIAFVSISLVVSSIMIGIITYISVLERTKEIGILRSIGASKKDISRVFNAETLIIGFVAGALGIGTTLLLNIPVNLLIESLSGISNVSRMPFTGAVILVLISMTLTLIAGLIPSGLAAKKDPVVALRTE